MSERGNIIADRLMICVHNGEIDNDDMKRIMEELSLFLGLKTLSGFARQEKISPVAALKRKNHRVIIAGVKFLVDND